MLLFLELGFSMGKSTGLPIGAFAILLEGFAELCLHLDLVVLRKDPPIPLEGERVLRFVLSS